MYFPFSLSPHRDKVKSLSDFRQERSLNLGVSRFLIRSIVYGSPITSSDSKENFQNPDNQSGIISRNSYALSLKLSCHLRTQIFIRPAAIRLQRLLSLPMLFISSEGNFHPYFPRIAAPTGTERGSEANPVSHDRVSPAFCFPASSRSLKKVLILRFSRCILPGCSSCFLSLSHHHPRDRRHLPPALPRACFLSHPCPQALFDRICSFILFISHVSARHRCADALPRLSVISQRSL